MLILGTLSSPKEFGLNQSTVLSCHSNGSFKSVRCGSKRCFRGLNGFLSAVIGLFILC